MIPTDPEVSSTTDELVAHTSPALTSARVLLWARQHGPLVALALFVLYDGGAIASAAGVIC